MVINNAEVYHMKRTLVLLMAALMVMASLSAMAESPFTADSPGKVSVAVFDRSNMDTNYGDATNNYWANWIKEQVLEQLNIEVTFVAMPRSNSDSIIPVWMAGGNCPDIFISYSPAILYDYAEQGGLYELSELIEQYGPNITSELGEQLPYGHVSGGQYAIVAKRGLVAHVSAFIRKDWCEAVGYELVADENGVVSITYDDLEKVMTQWKEQGLCEYPMAMLQEPTTYEAESMDSFTHAFIDYEKLTDEDVAVRPDILWPGVKEGYRWLNKLYNNGLIQPDWAIYGDETEWKSWISNGKVGVWAHAYWRELAKKESVEALYANHPEAEVVPISVTNNDGVAALVDRYVPYGMYMMVPVYSQHAAEAVMYIDWLSKYENFEYLAYGQEGEHYTKLENGAHDASTALPDARPRISVGDLVLTYNGNPDRDVAVAEMTSAIDERLKPVYEAAYYTALENTFEPYDFGKTIVARGDYGLSLNEKIGEIRVKAITGAVDAFDATYDTLVEEFLGMGGQTVIDESLAAYQEKEAK